MAGNQTDNVMLLDLTTGLPRIPETGGTPDTIQLSVDMQLISGANMLIDGDLTVNGTTTTIHSEIVNIRDNHLYLNADYTTAVAQEGGIVVNVLPTATTDTVAATGFTAGVAAVSNPTVITTGSATFAAGDIIQINGANDQTNDGVFEVDSHVGTTLTIRGVGTVATTQSWFQNDFVTDTTVAGTITLINVNVLQGTSSGDWQTVTTSSSTGLTYNTVTQQGVVDLQEAYEQGNTITTDAGNGDVVITGTEELVVTATGGINLDTVFDADVTVFDVQMTGANGFSIDGTAASNVTVDTGVLTLSTTTSGNVVVDSVDAVTIDAGDEAAATGNAVSVTAGDGGGANDGGAVNLTAGQSGAGATGNGGGINITAGDAASTDGDGGVILLATGSNTGTGTEGFVNITGTQSETEAILQLAPTGTNAQTVQFYTGTNSPNGVVTADAGSLYLRDTGSSGEVWVNDSTGSGTSWTMLSTSAGATLQSAYEAGNTISVSAAFGTIDFSNSTDATDVLTVSRTFAGAGEGITLNMGATTTGIGFDVNITAGATGNAVDIANDGDGDALFINNTGGGAALTVQDNGTDVLDIDTNGTFTVTPSSGQDATITTAGAGAVTIDSAAGGISLDSSAGASNFTVDTGGLTLSTTTAGTLLIDAVALLDVNAGANLDVDVTGTMDFLSTGAFSIDGTGASNVSATSGDLSLSSITTGSVLVDGVDGVEVNSSAGAINVGNDANTGAINVGTGAAARTITVGNSTGATGVVLNVGTGEFAVNSTVGEADPVVTWTTTGASGDSVEMFVGDNDPDGSVTGLAGSLFMRDTGTGGILYVNESTGSGTTWNPVVTTGNGTLTLQNAYIGGNTIVTDATNGDFDVSGTQAISLDAAMASNFTVTGASLTLSTATSGTVDITSADDIQMTFETNNATAMVIDDGTNNFVTFDSTTGDLAVEVNEFLDIVGDGAGITLTAATTIAVGDVVSLDTAGEVILADANTGTDTFAYAIGVAATAATATNPVRIYTVTGSLVPVNFAAAPGAATNGSIVFVSNTGGQGSITPPAGGGSVVYKIGILQGADGADTSPLVLWQPQFLAKKP